MDITYRVWYRVARRNRERVFKPFDSMNEAVEFAATRETHQKASVEMIQSVTIWSVDGTEE